MNISPLLYALLVGVLPSFVWLWFWVREDREHPEPRWRLALSFFAGAAVVIVAGLLEKYVATMIHGETNLYTAWAAIEEVLKFSMVILIGFKSRHNDEPVNAMVYCVTVALGFAALENTLFILDPLSHGEIGTALTSGNMRFIGATLVHVVSSATVGFTLGYCFYRRWYTKVAGVIVGLAAATALHAAFNLSIISISRAADASFRSLETLKTFAWFWGAVVVMIILFEEVKAVKPKLL